MGHRRDPRLLSAHFGRAAGVGLVHVADRVDADWEAPQAGRDRRVDRLNGVRLAGVRRASLHSGPASDTPCAGPQLATFGSQSVVGPHADASSGSYSVPLLMQYAPDNPGLAPPMDETS
jgi:hypothetical protein